MSKTLTPIAPDDLRETVRTKYAAQAQRVAEAARACCEPSCCGGIATADPITGDLYSEDEAAIVPTQALQTGPNGQYVYVVKADSTAEMRKVEIARTEGAQTVLSGGLQPGETVVVDGASRLLPGTRVAIKQPESAS